MAHGPVVHQNTHENDFSGVFDALHQSFLVVVVVVSGVQP